MKAEILVFRSLAFKVPCRQSLSAVIVAAVLTGAVGGVVRDVLAGPKHGVLRSEVYAGWSILD